MLETKLLQYLHEMPGNVILRADIKCGKTQISAALKSLISKGFLIKVSLGVYVKTRVSTFTGEIIPAASLEILAPEILMKLGIEATSSIAAQENKGGKSTQLPGKLVANTGSRRITRKIVVGGRVLFYENNYTNRRSP